MRKVFSIIIGGFLFSCGAPETEDDGYITSAGGDETIDSSQVEDEDEYDMLNQPLIVRYFFKLTEDQLSSDYCYDEAQVKNLLLGEGTDEYTWVSKLVKENYLRFDNDECYTTTEFAILNPDSNEPHAVLSQSSKGSQQLNIYYWNEGGGVWEEEKNYPKPKMTDFYNELTEKDAKDVRQFGAYFTLVSETDQTISFSYSTWQMGLNADGKEIMDFTNDPDFSFELVFDEEDGFWLKKVYENKTLIPERYFLAYSETGEITDDFSFFSDQIGEGLNADKVESVYADFSQTDYKAYFKSDTFDFSSMQQFEPRNGYWFFERGKEPLDLEYDKVELTLKKAQRYFGEQ